jgi:ATP-dependent Lon protease
LIRKAVKELHQSRRKKSEKVAATDLGEYLRRAKYRYGEGRGCPIRSASVTGLAWTDVRRRVADHSEAAMMQAKAR